MLQMLFLGIYLIFNRDTPNIIKCLVRETSHTEQVIEIVFLGVTQPKVWTPVHKTIAYVFLLLLQTALPVMHLILLLPTYKYDLCPAPL